MGPTALIFLSFSAIVGLLSILIGHSQERDSNDTNAFKTSVYITFSETLLNEASHIAESMEVGGKGEDTSE